MLLQLPSPCSATRLLVRRVGEGAAGGSRDSVSWRRHHQLMLVMLLLLVVVLLCVEQAQCWMQARSGLFGEKEVGGYTAHPAAGLCCQQSEAAK